MRETLRHALNCLALVAPDWLLAHSQPEWVERYEARMEDARTPLGDEARHAYAEVIGADGTSLLSAIYGGAAPGFLREIPAVQILRQVWVQNYTWNDGKMRWRSSEDICHSRHKMAAKNGITWPISRSIQAHLRLVKTA